MRTKKGEEIRKDRAKCRKIAYLKRLLTKDDPKSSKKVRILLKKLKTK